jgi:hypothetical protein
MTLSEALDIVYDHNDWTNPIRPYFVSSIKNDTPYEAFKKLKPEYQTIVIRMVGHTPEKDEE